MVLKVALATTIRPFFRGGSNFRKLEPAKIKISRSKSETIKDLKKGHKYWCLRKLITYCPPLQSTV